MPKSQPEKMKNNAYNIPIFEENSRCNLLLRPAGHNGAIIMELKRKAQHSSVFTFQTS